MKQLLRRSPLLYLLCGLALLLSLGGCGSAPGVPVYKPTGSWQGTITDPSGVSHPVQAIFAPGTNFRISLLDRTQIIAGTATLFENIGDGSVRSTYIDGNQNISIANGTTRFSFTATDALYGYLSFPDGRWNFSLQATAAAQRVTQQTDLAGGWSNLTDHLTSQLIIAPDGTITGGSPGTCTYSGSASQLDPDWNIFDVQLLISCPLPLNQSSNGTYVGLGMLKDTATGREFSQLLTPSGTTVRVLSPTWYATVNQPPLANPGISETRTILSGQSISLDGSASSDPNGDPLVYEWSVIATPGNVPLSLTNPTAAKPSFIPPVVGDYTFQMVVGDGQTYALPTFVTITVAFAADHFSDQGNGTILDNTSGLLWLKDANCFSFKDIDTAITTAAGLASGQCGLSDGSVAGDWRLPTRSELQALTDSTYYDPALPNGRGDAQWSSGDLFFNVLSVPYWSSDGDPASYDAINNWYLTYFTVNFLDGSSPSMAWNTLNRVWPVRSP